MFNLFKKKLTVVTHNGSFHADDVFACATLSLWAEKENINLKIVRSRDEKVIKKADIVVDVGMEYDPERKRFDHHQKGGAGTHPEGDIPYASFGLVWKHYGEIVCDNSEVVKIIEKKLVIPVDAMDNGINISNPIYPNIVENRTSHMLCKFALTRQEDESKVPDQFKKVIYFAQEIIKREVAWANAFVEGEKLTTKAIKEQNDPSILVLDQDTEWEEAASKSGNTKLVIYFKTHNKEWCIQTVRDDLENYKSNRASFPKEWRGLQGKKLVEISGIKDSMFCHGGGFFASATSKEGAIEMAKRALNMVS